MDRASLDAELARVLSPGGRSVWFSASPSTTFFGCEEFNRLFFSLGFEKHNENGQGPTRTLKIDRPMTHAQLHDFVVKRGWSNLKIMTAAQIDLLASMIPLDLRSVELHIDAHETVR